MEVTLLMNWWTYLAKALASSDSSEVKKVMFLFVAGMWCQLLVAKTICANLLLKHQDAILGKLKGNMFFESFLGLRNALLLGFFELSPKGSSVAGCEEFE